MAEVVELVIREVGARGDGVAMHGGARVFVPFTLPGERVRARLRPGRGDRRADAQAILAPAPERVSPPCPHFGRCGGCALQHMAADDYAEWKRAQVRAALARHGLGDVPVEAPLLSPPGSRRRAVLKAARAGGEIHLGFNARLSHRVIDIGATCPVLTPTLAVLLPRLRRLLASVLPTARNIGVVASETDSGLDVLLVSEDEPGLADRERMAAFADEAGLARLAWQPVGGAAEPVAERRPVLQRFGGVPVPLPPGAFLQPTRAGENALVRFVAEAAAGAARAADLYAGAGTFTFPLAADAAVHAVEGAPALAGAVAGAARTPGLAGRVTVEPRDLAARPLLPDELARFDLVVLDPPRAGARAQAEALAATRVPTVAAVSCNPATFARDARILVDGGYRLLRVQPVDQFVWSAQVELAALFRREGARG